ncbi:TerD family protein [Streptomyces sp. NPDC047976]|uniref:TerD family protein n=1 Tax=Streptomyces sp. NPDC047976 TaxID=3155746 RepID=UPI00343DABDD
MLRGLIKGDNAFVPTVALRVAVRNGVDVAALLVTEQGRVRGDADIVFDGAPAHPSGAVRLSAGEDGTVWLETGLTSVEEEITRVLVVASTEEGALRDVRGLSVEVFGPDGATVVGYEVTDAGGETAMVLAELYRRSGGWKFRAVGQGYVDGLTGLAVDHGVDVDEEPQEVLERIPAPAPPAALAAPAEAPPAAPAEAQAPLAAPPAPAQGLRLTRDQILDMTPEQIRALALTQRQARAEAPGQAQAPLTASSPPAPKPDPSAWTCGPVFKPRTVTGRDNDVITVKDLPHGPVIVELTLKGDGYTGLWPLDASNAKGRYLVSTTEKDFRGRVITSAPEHGRLRLRLEASGSWQVRILPLAEARRLSKHRLESWGPDVLLHTGGTADVTFHYKGDSNFIGHVYRLAGHTDPTTLPEPGRSVVSEIGARRETLPLPEGPLLVYLSAADGPWDARLKDVHPHSSGRDADGPAKLPEPRGALGWLRRARR